MSGKHTQNEIAYQNKCPWELSSMSTWYDRDTPSWRGMETKIFRQHAQKVVWDEHLWCKQTILQVEAQWTVRTCSLSSHISRPYLSKLWHLNGCWHPCQSKWLPFLKIKRKESAELHLWAPHLGCYTGMHWQGWRKGVRDWEAHITPDPCGRVCECSIGTLNRLSFRTTQNIWGAARE